MKYLLVLAAVASIVACDTSVKSSADATVVEAAPAVSAAPVVVVDAAPAVDVVVVDVVSVDAGHDAH